MSLLDRKLLRDLLAMRAQVITIALVVAAGIAVFVASVSTYDSLRAARDRFYIETHFPQVFATLKRAPLSLAARIAEIPGVAGLEARIVQEVIVDLPGSPLSISAKLISIANGGDEPLAKLHMRSGSAPQPRDPHGVALSEAFADANGMRPGEDIRLILNGRLQAFRISGIALSSEYVYAVKPGLPIPDDRLYAILWVDRSAAEAAFDMKGAFNDVVVSLSPGTDPQPVVAELDRLLEPYGAVGAVARRDQPSNRFLEDELTQQKVMSTTIPIIFFGVAAFLLNVSLGRVVAAQREQIAALKALGFSNGPILGHYLKLVLVIVLLGSLVGTLLGLAFGRAMIVSYHQFFRLPDLSFEITPWSVLVGTAVSLATASIGVLSALQSVVRLPPAVAMRPAAPLRFHRSWVESLFAARILNARRTMMLRNVTGRPVRTTLTVLGIALAVPMVVLALFWRDALDRMVEIQFELVERGNVVATFPHPLDRAIVRDLARQPGVLIAEGERIVPVRLRAGHRSYLTSVIGLPPKSELRRPHDASLRPIEVSPEGITLTRRLADRLAVGTGDILTVEVMEGWRRKRDLPVAAIVDETLGMSSYMEIDSLNRLTGEGAVVSAVEMYVDPAAVATLSKRFKDLPVIEAVAMKAYTLSAFLDKIAGLVLISAAILTGFAVIIAVGVVYNNARIGLQERARELASLRVLGFSSSEVGRILFEEFTFEIMLGVPIGLLLSRAMVGLIAQFHSNESFEIPAVIGAQTYVAAAVVVVAAALVSSLLVWRQIKRLDLVSVLKTRD